jgi:signal transduction histidine kinase
MIENVQQIPLFSEVSAQQEGCVLFLQQGTEVWLEPGEYAARQGDPVEFFYVLLDGEMQITKQIGGQEALITTYGAGAFFGELPLLLDTPYIASIRSVTQTRLYGLNKEIFWKMLATCPTVRRKVLQTMGQRVSHLEGVAQGHQRLASLGTMAAGLAHELNNPAAAARRAASQLRETVERLQPVDCDLRRQALASLPKGFFSELRREVTERAPSVALLDALARSDREQEMVEALDVLGVEDGWQLANGLTDVGLDVPWLRCLADRVPAEALADVLRWLGASLGAEGLLDEIEQSTRRVSDLVDAMKSYSYLDQAPTQEIDVCAGLDDTLTVLGHKIKVRNVQITRQYAPGLPRITAYGSELNQVWTNLIDNALDAVGEGGGVCVSREPDRLLIEIGDDGPGIPSDVQPRIFDPFFTTKPVGEGTGLGLDVSYRIVVNRHKGDIRVLSHPGDTRFQVRLPLA